MTNRPPALTEPQKKRFAILKKQLYAAKAAADVDGLQSILSELKALLLNTGHHTKYYEMLLHLCDLHIKLRLYNKSKKYLLHIYNQTSNNTRIHQEATTLLSIAELHLHNYSQSAKYFKIAVNSPAIKNDNNRIKFIENIIRIYEEESILTSLESSQHIEYDSKDLLKEVQYYLSRSYSESDLIENIGRNTPPSSVDFMNKMNELAKNQLSYQEQKMLPPPPGCQDIKKIGDRVFNSINRRLWNLVCPTNAKLQTVIKKLDDPGIIAAAIFTEIATIGIPFKAVIAAITTITIKHGIKSYCTKFPPRNIMDFRYKRL